MNLGAVMDEVGAVLATVSGLRVFDYPPPTLVPPAGVVSYPEAIAFDQTYGRGMDRIGRLPVLLIEGRANDRAARDRVARWAAGGGDGSIKAVFESHDWVSCDVVTVTECTFDVVQVAGIDYIAALFSLDIAGSGA